MYESASSVRIAFALYIGLTFLLAYLARRQAVQGGFLREFFVGGRTIGPWVLGLTWIATAASGGTFIGAPALAHANGWSVMLWISGYIVVATTGFGLLGRRIAEAGRQDRCADVSRPLAGPIRQPSDRGHLGRRYADSPYQLHRGAVHRRSAGA